MTTECAYCRKARNLPPGATLCVTPCLERLETALLDVPDLSDQLLTTLARQDRRTAPGQSGGGGLKAESQEPSNRAVTDPSDSLMLTLRPWADILDADHGKTTAIGYSRRIHAHLNHIRSRPDAAELVDEILDAYHRARRVIDLPPTKIFLGECGTENEGEECPGHVTGIRHGHEARCDTCGHTYPQQERVRTAISNSWDEKGTLQAVVAALNAVGVRIKLNTAKQWVKRGILRTPWTNPRTGTRFYTMSQVVEVMQSQQDRSRTRKKRRAA